MRVRLSIFRIYLAIQDSGGVVGENPLGETVGGSALFDCANIV